MAAASRASDSPSTRAASAVELAATCSAPGTCWARNFWHWARAWGYEDTRAMSLERGAGLGHQVEVDVHDDLALDVEVDVEDQPVDGGAHRALDGVLDGDEAQVDPARGHLLEDGGDGRERPQVGRGQVRLGQQRLLGEGGGRAEVGDRGRRRVHSRAG